MSFIALTFEKKILPVAEPILHKYYEIYEYIPYDDDVDDDYYSHARKK